MKVHITDNGNLLIFHPVLKKYYFSKPNGDFIREVSNLEGEYLETVCLPVTLEDTYNSYPEFLPIWHNVITIKVTDDYSKYKPETSNNGGDYSFHTFRDWFVGKFPDNTWKFAVIEIHSTSAEFSYDELFANFSTDLGTVMLINTENQNLYTSHAGVTWTSEGKVYHVEDVLEKVGMIDDFKSMWNTSYMFIPEDGSNLDITYSPALNLSHKKEVISRLRSLGITHPKKKSRNLKRNRR